MWRLFGLKNLLILIMSVGILITILLMSRAPSILSSSGKRSHSSNLKQHEDSEMIVYAGGSHLDDGKLSGNADYPFVDTDFDQVAVPGEEQSSFKKDQHIVSLNPPKSSNSRLIDVTCDVNNGKFILQCKKDPKEIFVPFSFLQKYYEMYGKMGDEETTFLISHSPPVKIYRPKNSYDPTGIFAFFDNYNVEVRDRVKCISGAWGVPVSTQWDAHGYFYPIQIAQFGLSHYSKYITDTKSKRVTLENGGDTRAQWIIHNYPPIRIAPDPDNPENQVISIRGLKRTKGSQSDGSIKLSLENVQPHLLLLSLVIRTTGAIPSNVTITVGVTFDSNEYFLHYTTASDQFIKIQNNQVYYGLGSVKSQDKWQRIIRDVGVDLQKGLLNPSPNNKHNKKSSQRKVPRSKVYLRSLAIRIENSYDTPLLIDNITLSSNEHLAQFFQAVDWFVQNQDAKGGWGIPVARTFHSGGARGGFYPTLKAGWYSAMGQGHALSLLSRAYAITKESKYAEACESALRTIFDQSGQDNEGVRALFMEEFVWFEEYPTTPSSFVLNGFMYALLGLYDVSTTFSTVSNEMNDIGGAEKAKKLYKEGLRSLLRMLPLFDTGHGSFYDLRHFTVPGISPNLARLDYHLTHINQLLLFSSIHPQHQLFKTVAERWIGYLNGERAAHN